MKRSTLIVLGFAVGIALLIGVFQTFSFSEFIAILAGLQTDTVLAYLAVSFVIFLLLAYRFTVVVGAHGTHLPFRQALNIRYIGFAISFITPGPRVGGEPVRAALLKPHGMTFPQGLSAVIADKTIELTSWGLMIVLSLLVAILTVPLPTALKTTFILIGLAIFSLIGYGFTQMLRGNDPVLKLFKLFRLHRIKALRKYEGELQEFEKNILNFYGKNARSFWWAQAVSAAAWALSLIEFKLLLMMIGIDASFFQLLLVYSVVGVAYLIPIPLALGVMEAGQATLFVALGFSAAAGAFVAMMTRARDILWTLIGFVILTYFGFDAVRNDA